MKIWSVLSPNMLVRSLPISAGPRLLAPAAAAMALGLAGCSGSGLLLEEALAGASEARPRAADGRDASGTARAALAGDACVPEGLDWQQALGGEGLSITGSDIGADVGGGVVVVGRTDGALEEAQHQGSSDAFAARWSSEGDLLWVRQLGTAAADAAAGVGVGSDGSLFVAGTTSGALGGDPAGFGDAFVARFAEGGEVEWTRQLGTTAPDEAAGASASADGGVFVAGTTRGVLEGARAGSDADVFVARYSADGELLFTAQLGSQPGYDDHAAGVSAGPDGEVVVAGRTFGELAGENLGSADAFVSKWSASGERVWTVQLGGSDHDTAEAVSTDASGAVFVAGQVGGWLVRGPGGVLPGAPRLTKVSAEGEVLWDRVLEAGSMGSATALSTDDSGDVYVAGYTAGALGGPNQGLYDAFVAKYSGEGELLWVEQPGVLDNDRATGVAADGCGNVFVGQVATGIEPPGDRTLISRLAGSPPAP